MAVLDTLSNLRAGDTDPANVSNSGDCHVLTCPACRGCSWEPTAGVRGVALSRCSGCRLLATTHFVTKTRTTDGLYDVDSENLAIYREQYLPHRLKMYARFLPQLERFRQTGRLLEVGSGYGYFLDMACKAKWASEGVEISRYCCQVARQYGCTVRQGRLQDAGFVQGTFDVVVLWDVIEHFTQPHDIISLTHDLLRRGGALVMRTPDGRALAPSFTRGVQCIGTLPTPQTQGNTFFISHRGTLLTS